MGRIADLVFLTRPPLLCASSTFFFAGAASALRFVGEPYSVGRMAESLPNLALFTLVAASAFVVNQIFDVESDRVNRKGFLLPQGVVSRRDSAMLLVGLGAAAVGLSLVSDVEMRYLVWLGLGLGFLYSAPPFRLKGRPVLDLLANVLAFGVVGFAMGWLVYSDMGSLLWIRCAPYALAMGGIFLNTCIPDEEGDRVAGDATSCVAFGRVAVARAAVALMFASVVVGILSGENLCVLAVVGSLPAIVAVGTAPSPMSSVVASQFGARLLLILVSIEAPLLALVSVGTYLASRVYYKRRFDLRYPDLEGAGEAVPTSL